MLGLPHLGASPHPPVADALQTHNAVFQEHAAPSSPGTAPTSRGFRRASEISIASQVSGLAESYTASSIAQSECSLPRPPHGHSVSARGLSAQGWPCPETVLGATTGEGVLVA